MIPRLQPPYGLTELLSAGAPHRKEGVDDFERCFAAAVGAQFAVAFPYGRSGLHTLLKCLHIEHREVIVPAYTCSVVTDAVVCSGNYPRFVDIQLRDFNTDLRDVMKAVSEKTGAVVATHMYGFPMRGMPELERFCCDRGILLVQDCALGPTTSLQGRSVHTFGDAALHSFSIGKHISTVEGGMISTEKKTVYEKLVDYRARYFRPPGSVAIMRKWLFGLALLCGLHPVAYPLTLQLSRKTHLLDAATIYRYDEARLPEGATRLLSAFQARLGISQVSRLREIAGARIAMARFYARQLDGLEGILLPEPAEGATYSHFPLVVRDRESVRKRATRRGVHLGVEMFDYALPHCRAFKRYAQGEFPNASRASRETLLLPLTHKLSRHDCEKVVTVVRYGVRNAGHQSRRT